VRLAPRLELQQQTLPQVPGADARGVELLNDAEHLLGLDQRVRLRSDVLLRCVGVSLEYLVHAVHDLLEGRAEIPVFRDVADELFGQELLAGREVEQPHLLAQVIRQILGLDRHRLDVLACFAHVPGRGALIAAVVQEDLLPVGLVVLLGLLLVLLGLLSQRYFRFLLSLDELEERIAEQLLLEVLLEIEQRHVQQVHRLVQTRIDPQLLRQRRVLLEAGLHAACVRRARKRAVRVGPRYRCATRSSNTSSRTVPATCTFPSNMMYARSTISRVCSTLWPVSNTPLPRCREP